MSEEEAKSITPIIYCKNCDHSRTAHFDPEYPQYDGQCSLDMSCDCCPCNCPEFEAYD